MGRSFRRVLGLISLMVVSVVLTGCSTSVIGTYVDQKKSDNTIELQPNGIFVAKTGTTTTEGIYKMQGDVLTLTSGSMSMTAELVNRKFTVGDQTYVRK